MADPNALSRGSDELDAFVGRGGQRTGERRRINPAAQVRALVDTDGVPAQSLTGMKHMDEVYAASVATDVSSCQPGTAAACGGDVQHNGFARLFGSSPLDQWRLT